MSYWSTLPLQSQRHYCLEAARRYKRAQQELLKARAALTTAQEAAKALGVTVAPAPGYGCRDVSHHRVALPQEAAVSTAEAGMAVARRALFEALEDCPAVLAEVFSMLGCP